MRPSPLLLAALLAGGSMVTGCQGPHPRQSSADQAKVAACRAETDRAYRVRDRIAQFRPEQRDSPFSSNYSPGNTARGLGELFGRDQMEEQCLRNQGVGHDTPDASTGPAFNTQTYQR